MSEYHEKWDSLPEEIRNQHRALASLTEELEAVDWYNQRVALTEDDELRAILEHNRDEEIEHAAMLLEWLRRRGGKWDKELHTYLYTTEPIVDVEEDGGNAETSLGIGSMKGRD